MRRYSTLKKYIVITIFILLFVSGNICAEYYNEPDVRIEGQNLIYEGILCTEGFNKIKSSVKKNKQKIEWLYINSGGGEIGVSMDIGSWVFNNGINVKVYNVCLSSCANYVFPAGKQKVIAENSIVAWHGSAMQNSLNYLPIEQIDTLLASIEDPKEKEEERKRIIKSHEKYVAKMKRKQKTFFNMIGVDPIITVIGQKNEYRVDNFWSVSVKEMNKFGIDNVSAPENYIDFVMSKTDQVTVLNLKDDLRDIHK